MKVLKIVGDDQILCGLLVTETKIIFNSLHNERTMVKFRQIRFSCNNKSGY